MHAVPGLYCGPPASPADFGTLSVRSDFFSLKVPRPRTESGACTNEGAALEWVSRRLRDDRSIRAAAWAERAALIASVGGVDKLDYFWARLDKTRQQRDRESRAANFDRRPRFSGMFFF